MKESKSKVFKSQKKASMKDTLLTIKDKEEGPLDGKAEGLMLDNF